MMKSCLRVISIGFVAALGLTVPARAATRNAANCSQAAVAAAVGSAADGDTVTIPAGNCIWSSGLTISKGITLLGSGIGQTTIVNQVPGVNLITITTPAQKAVRVSGFSIANNTDGSNYWFGVINIFASTKAFRIDHLAMTSLNNLLAVYLDGDAWGVIDNNTFRGSYMSGVFIHHTNWGGSSWGDGSWAAPLTLGAAAGVYIESNEFIEDLQPPALTDCADGGRFVFRRNRVVNNFVGTHGTEDRRRGCRSYEIYENTFVTANGIGAWTVSYLRGGTGVIWGNTVDAGYPSIARPTDYRKSILYAPYGLCNGSSPYDGNQPGQSGYRCVDQVGAGTSRDLGGVDNPTPQPVNNILDPLYVWGNSGGPGNSVSIDGDAPNIQMGRDVIVGPARPGYTPYVYPHPLVTGSPAPPSTPPPSSSVPPPPQNLRILGSAF